MIESDRLPNDVARWLCYVCSMNEGGRLNPGQRAREKQASRDADQRDLASGRRSAAEISHANNMFSGLGPSALRNARVIFPEKK